MGRNLSVFGTRLREARIKAGLSQKKLGVIAGIDEFTSSPRINQYERGVHNPDYTTAERLAKVLNVPVPYFYTRDDQLAAILLMISKLSEKGQNTLLASLRKRMGKVR